MFNFEKYKFKFGFRDYLKKILLTQNEHCDLKFGYNHCKIPGSNKKKSALFRVDATCKVPG